MKIIFLDVDGVLNNDKTTERFKGFLGLDMGHVNLLKEWLEKRPDVSIVLSSTWRTDPDFFDHLTNYFDISSYTDVLPWASRDAEISKWLADYARENNVTHYAILDDITEWPTRKANVVWVQNGLYPHHLEQLDKLLGY
jgi:hypothetical protein